MNHPRNVSSYSTNFTEDHRHSFRLHNYAYRGSHLRGGRRSPYPLSKGPIQLTGSSAIPPHIAKGKTKCGMISTAFGMPDACKARSRGSASQTSALAAASAACGPALPTAPNPTIIRDLRESEPICHVAFCPSPDAPPCGGIRPPRLQGSKGSELPHAPPLQSSGRRPHLEGDVPLPLHQVMTSHVALHGTLEGLTLPPPAADFVNGTSAVAGFCHAPSASRLLPSRFCQRPLEQAPAGDGGPVLEVVTTERTGSPPATIFDASSHGSAVRQAELGCCEHGMSSSAWTGQLQASSGRARRAARSDRSWRDWAVQSGRREPRDWLPPGSKGALTSKRVAGTLFATSDGTWFDRPAAGTAQELTASGGTYSGRPAAGTAQELTASGGTYSGRPAAGTAQELTASGGTYSGRPAAGTAQELAASGGTSSGCLPAGTVQGLASGIVLGPFPVRMLDADVRESARRRRAARNLRRKLEEAARRTGADEFVPATDSSSGGKGVLGGGEEGGEGGRPSRGWGGAAGEDEGDSPAESDSDDEDESSDSDSDSGSSSSEADSEPEPSSAEFLDPLATSLASLGCVQRIPAEASRLGVEQTAALGSPVRLGYWNQVPERSLVPHGDTPEGSGWAESPQQGPPGDVSMLYRTSGTKGAARQAPTCDTARRKHCGKMHACPGGDPEGAVRWRVPQGGSEGPTEKGLDQRQRGTPRASHARAGNTTLPSKMESGRHTPGGRRERRPHSGPAVPHMASLCGGRNREDRLEASSRRGGFCSPMGGTGGIAALQAWLERTGEAITRRPRGSTRYTWHILGHKFSHMGVHGKHCKGTGGLIEVQGTHIVLWLQTVASQACLSRYILHFHVERPRYVAHCMYNST
eukprot:jgi/Botrbrau1/3972/Bobra.0365s0045.1